MRFALVRERTQVLGDAYSNYFGRFDDAAKEVREAITLNAKDADLYSSLAVWTHGRQSAWPRPAAASAPGCSLTEWYGVAAPADFQAARQQARSER